MGLERQQVAPFQRADEFDFDQLGKQIFDNLALGIRHFVAPSTGIVRGGSVTPGGGLFVDIARVSAVDAAGKLIIIEPATTQIGPFSPNASGLDRIDLVSLEYMELAGEPENRVFINPAAGTTSTQSTNTRVKAMPQFVITQGTPAGSPVAPATPAGHIALAEITIRDGAADILVTDIAMVEGSRVQALRSRLSPNVGPPVTFPYLSNPLEGLLTPLGSGTLLVGWLTCNLWAHSNDYFFLRIVNHSTLAVFATATYPKVASSAAPEQTMFVATFIPGPFGPIDYALQLERDDLAAGSVGLTTVTSVGIASITF